MTNQQNPNGTDARQTQGAPQPLTGAVRQRPVGFASKDQAAQPSNSAPYVPSWLVNQPQGDGQEKNRAPRGQSGQGSGPITLTRGLLVALIVACVVLGALIFVIISAVSSCSTSSQPASTATSGQTQQGFVSNYNWDKLANDEHGLLAYYDANGNKLSAAGVDVSSHDGSVDWQAVKASGVDFAIIQLGYRGYTVGSVHLDEQFYNNITGAAAAGIDVGVYFFSQAISEDEAREEAQFVVDTLRNVNVTLTYPVVFDEEYIADSRTDGLTGAQLTANALAFLKTVESAGYVGMLYGNKSDMESYDLSGELGNYGVWYAEYGVSHPSGEYNMEIWQYTDTGTISGLGEGTSDINVRLIAG